jgi:SAM-dependent methyltransferase
MTEPPQGHYPIERRAGEIERLHIQSAALAMDAAIMLELIGVREGWRCLDLGCGPEGITTLLADRVGAAGKVVGLDVDGVFLEHARERARVRGQDNTQFVAGNVYGTDLPAGSFDLVHSRFVASTAGGADRLLQEAVRLTRPGGVVAFQEPDMATLNCYPAHPAWQSLRGALRRSFRTWAATRGWRVPAPAAGGFGGRQIPAVPGRVPRRRSHAGLRPGDDRIGAHQAHREGHHNAKPTGRSACRMPHASRRSQHGVDLPHGRSSLGMQARPTACAAGVGEGRAFFRRAAGVNDSLREGRRAYRNLGLGVGSSNFPASTNQSRIQHVNPRQPGQARDSGAISHHELRLEISGAAVSSSNRHDRRGPTRSRRRQEGPVGLSVPGRTAWAANS